MIRRLDGSRQWALVLTVFAATAHAQVAIWGPGEAILRSGDACPLQAGAATAAEVAWDWAVLEADGGTVLPEGAGRATYTAPFVAEPRTFTVRASVASDRRACADLRLRVEPHGAYGVLERILGRGWAGPRLEPFVGRGGLSLGTDGRKLADARLLPRSVVFVDHPAAGLERRWLFTDQGSNTLKTVTEDGRVATFAGRERRVPAPWAAADPMQDLTGAFELKGRMGSLDGPPDVAQFCAPLALAVRPATQDWPLRILVTEAGSAAVRWVDEQGNVGTLVGALDPASARRRTCQRSPFISPWGLAAAADGTLYLADPGMRAVFRIAPDGIVARVVDSRQVPGAGDFRHLALDPARGVLFVSDGHGVVRVALDGKEPPRFQKPRRAGSGLIRGLVLHRGLLFIAEENGALRVQDPECGCERLLTVPRAVRLDHGSVASSASQPRFGPLRGDPPAFPGIALCLAFNDRGIGLVGSPDCLAELYLDEGALGEGCPSWHACAPEPPGRL